MGEGQSGRMSKRGHNRSISYPDYARDFCTLQAFEIVDVEEACKILELCIVDNDI